jgi:hypothetical protein
MADFTGGLTIELRPESVAHVATVNPGLEIKDGRIDLAWVSGTRLGDRMTFSIGEGKMLYLLRKHVKSMVSLNGVPVWQDWLRSE